MLKLRPELFSCGAHAGSFARHCYAFVVGDYGILVDDHGAAFCISLAHVHKGNAQILRSLAEPAISVFFVMDEVLARAWVYFIKAGL